MALGNETVAALENVLKTKYHDKCHLMAYEEDWFLQNVRKDLKFGGNDCRISLRYGHSQGGSATYTDADEGQTSSESAGFFLTRAKGYHLISMDAEALLAGEGSENTVLNAVDAAMEGGTRMIGHALAIGVNGDGTGTRGIIDAATTLTGPVLKLKSVSTIINFERQQRYQFADPVALTLRDSGDFLTVIGVDRDTGEVTFDGDLDDIAGIAVGDLVVRKGDFKKDIAGLAAWLPLDRTNLDDLFMQQDRSLDKTRLAGVMFDGEGNDKADTLQRALTRLSREGGKDKNRVGLVNIETLAEISIELGAKAHYYPAESGKGTAGFDTLIISTPRGMFKLVGSLLCPPEEFYILDMSTWVLKSIKKAPHIVDDDGRTILRLPNSDAVGWRLRYFAQLGCDAPGWNLHGIWGT